MADKIGLKNKVACDRFQGVAILELLTIAL